MMLLFRLLLHAAIFATLVMGGLIRLLWEGLASIQPEMGEPTLEHSSPPSLSFSVSADQLQDSEPNPTYHA